MGPSGATPSTHTVLDRIKAEYLYFSDASHGTSIENQRERGINMVGDYNELKNSTVAYSSGTLVHIAGKGNRVVNNSIHDGDYIATHDSLIRLSSGTENVIDHNEIRDSGRGIISIYQGSGEISYNDINRGKNNKLRLGDGNSPAGGSTGGDASRCTTARGGPRRKRSLPICSSRATTERMSLHLACTLRSSERCIPAKGSVRCMSQYVTVSCIGPRPLDVERTVPPEEVVDRMIEHWRKQLEQVLPDRPDLIVLPEVCDRPNKIKYGHERIHAYYQVRKNRIRDFLADTAKRHRCYITYPAHTIAADGTWRNAMQLLDRDGRVAGDYHKNYLVPHEYDENRILYGKEAPLIACDFGKVATAICFDLNFEELRGCYAKAKPDLILFPSMYHGGAMQSYWAYTCRAYFAGAVAGNPCTIVTPLGEVAAHSTNYYPFVTAKINLDYAVLHIDENEAHFAAMKKKYGPRIKIHDPGYLGCVLLTSETDEFTVQDVIAEFGLELMDDYFRRVEEARLLPGRMEP